ncbi:MAG: flagellar hook-associated protein 3 [Variovorax sp.]|jgi:flagellar hook-associated protein 3 FlgL|nr:MAG: flagellar hook-associated protein 3 [Variovorax sp.]
MSATPRLASANVYENTVSQLTTRQSQLSKLQEQLSASKRVLRPSDDPTAAGQAERAITRMARVTSDQRALEVQRNAVATAESTLRDASTAMQSFRTLLVQAGNTSLNTSDRTDIAQQLSTLRDQLVGFANTRDSNGQPLFGGLGSTAEPFADVGGTVVFNGITGQAGAGENDIPATLDGQATWMDVPTGNGVFAMARGNAAAKVSSDAGQVTNPAALTGHGYSVTFTVAAGATTYDVVDTTTNTAVLSAQPFRTGQAIGFDGLSFVASGTPASGDSLVVSPSTKASLFGVLDQAIAGVRDAGNTSAVAQGVAQGLAQVDSALSRLSATRGRAGDLLNRVDNITDRQDARSLQLEADRSRAEDLDMVKALSSFKTQETAYSAALGSYAQIQKLSLFNYIS